MAIVSPREKFHPIRKGGGEVTTATASKPKALAVIPEAIPLELKAIPQWVVWKYVPGIDKETARSSGWKN